MNTSKFDFNDILLTPATISNINSRNMVNPYDDNGMLPIMTAPMDTVIDRDNASKFIDNKVYAILPRGINPDVLELDMYKKWNSYGLEEFYEKFIESNRFHNIDSTHYALLDVANGHMYKLLQLVEKTKEIYGKNMCLMVGNIANPDTYKQYARLGVDYIRCGIGGGQGCLTSVQTGVGYPMASLISECYQIKTLNCFETKIVADGGFKTFADINKALALGADYVMLGSMLNKCLESCSPCVTLHGANSSPITIERALELLNLTDCVHKPYKMYRGMSTKEVQKSWGKTKLTTAEGISKFNLVEYTLAGFVENLEDYLRSAMSYTGSENLNEFKDIEYTLITQASYNRFNK